MIQTVRPAQRIDGTVNLPADKSLSHRAALFAALSDGVAELIGFSDADDPHSTLDCFRALGVRIEAEGDRLLVHGRGIRGLQPPTEPLDCGNSGTTMRLMAGILAGQPFSSTLTGDASLSTRPMDRIIEPLRAMGATIESTDGHAPLHITGRPLKGITYPLPMPSAQVKSCVLLAGMYAEGETTVIEPVPSRDHTERMLGLTPDIVDGKRHFTIRRRRRIIARPYRIPADFSAAAFFLVAGSIVPEGELRMEKVGLNPTRTGFLKVLQHMGADITISNTHILGGEPLADLVVRPAALKAVDVYGPAIPLLIDEVPVLAVAAACAEGKTTIRDAAELRVKETDRIAAMVNNLGKMGAAIEALPDGMCIEGGQPLNGAFIPTYNDHRIAMAMGIAGLVAEGKTRIKKAETAYVSFPGFWDQLRAIIKEKT